MKDIPPLSWKFSNFSLFSIVYFKKKTHSNRKLKTKNAKKKKKKTKNAKAILYLLDKHWFVAIFRSGFCFVLFFFLLNSYIFWKCISYNYFLFLFSQVFISLIRDQNAYSVQPIAVKLLVLKSLLFTSHAERALHFYHTSNGNHRV